METKKQEFAGLPKRLYCLVRGEECMLLRAHATREHFLSAIQILRDEKDDPDLLDLLVYYNGQLEIYRSKHGDLEERELCRLSCVDTEPIRMAHPPAGVVR